jgi:hypothetical protein
VKEELSNKIKDESNNSRKPVSSEVGLETSPSQVLADQYTPSYKHLKTQESEKIPHVYPKIAKINLLACEFSPPVDFDIDSYPYSSETSAFASSSFDKRLEKQPKREFRGPKPNPHFFMKSSQRLERDSRVLKLNLNHKRNISDILSHNPEISEMIEFAGGEMKGENEDNNNSQLRESYEKNAVPPLPIHSISISKRKNKTSSHSPEVSSNMRQFSNYINRSSNPNPNQSATSANNGNSLNNASSAYYGKGKYGNIKELAIANLSSDYKSILEAMQNNKKAKIQLSNLDKLFEPFKYSSRANLQKAQSKEKSKASQKSKSEKKQKPPVI